MRPYTHLGIFACLIILLVGWIVPTNSDRHFFKASDKRFQYVGRIDFSNKELPRFWSPGVYIIAEFKGTSCEIELNDEEMYGKDHNYISVVIDKMPVKRIKLSEKNNLIKFAEGLADTKHTITICKSTESGIGYLEFVGLHVDQLLMPRQRSKQLKMEFIGDSITSGTGSDVNEFPCNTGAWYDQHNAYMSYGPVTARALKAEWVLTAVAGIGLTRSCCKMDLIMPDVIDKISLRDNTIPWDFNKYQPDVVTVCLGQNDGILDSTLFCNAYQKFLSGLRGHYPKATIVCLTSPMAENRLVATQQKYLTSIVQTMNARNDRNVYSYFFSKRYKNGCGGHPDIKEHSLIAKELSSFISNLKKWDLDQTVMN